MCWDGGLRELGLGGRVRSRSGVRPAAVDHRASAVAALVIATPVDRAPVLVAVAVRHLALLGVQRGLNRLLVPFEQILQQQQKLHQKQLHLQRVEQQKLLQEHILKKKQKVLLV